MKTKGKAFKRAIETKDIYRLTDPVPLIQDSTELITPEIAQKILEKNKNNRPVNWNKVEEYRKAMEGGEWKFHAQGIILDSSGNVLTGQKRLLAIMYSGIPQYMRISRGSSPDTVNLIDRGTPQSSRDLASRATERKHSPIEGSIVRAICAMTGNTKPSADDLSHKIVVHNEKLQKIMIGTRGIPKTKDRLMVLAVICVENRLDMVGEIEGLGAKLIAALSPTLVESCWGRSAAFTLAMEKAKAVVLGSQ